MSAEAYLPDRISLTSLRGAVDGCRGCELYRDATQAVFGEGLVRAQIMMVGEQPGDAEDVQGRPFVGPAGRLLDRSLEAAGIDRREVYVTNVVKHFKFRRRGKRRIHDKPTHYEIEACKPWLAAEIEVVEPRVLVLLGSSAAKAILGSKFRVTQHRGEALQTDWAPITFATVHPSSLLRIPDATERRRARAAYIEELRHIGSVLHDVLGEPVGQSPSL